MTKAELVEKVCSEANLSRAAAEKAVNAFTSSVMEAVKKDDKVNLVGFGTFSLSKRAARDGRNPQTGERIRIKAANIPKFKPGKQFKDFIN